MNRSGCNNAPRERRIREDRFDVGWYQSDQVEQLLAQARSTPDPAGSAKIYQQIEKILNDDVARIYVLHSRQPKAYAKKVRGFVNPHSWAYTFNNVWIAG